MKLEGDFSDNRNDPGGITRYGISIRFIRSLDPATLKRYGLMDYPDNPEKMASLPWETAYRLYEGEFWQHAPFGEIPSQKLCNDVFDSAVNQGIGNAIKCLQRAVWASSGGSAITEDGIMGPKTIQAVQKCAQRELNAAFRAERAWHYRKVAELNPQCKIFLKGWLRRAYLQD